MTLTCQTEPELNTTINTTDGKVIGIDISHHQGNIDWSEVSTWDGNPIQFIYMKATEGATYQDPKYKTYMKEAKEQNKPEMSSKNKWLYPSDEFGKMESGVQKHPDKS